MNGTPPNSQMTSLLSQSLIQSKKDHPPSQNMSMTNTESMKNWGAMDLLMSQSPTSMNFYNYNSTETDVYSIY